MRSRLYAAICVLAVPLALARAGEPAPLPHVKPVAAAARVQQPAAAPEADAPVLVGAKSAAHLIELKARNVPKGTAVIWDVTPEDRATVRIIKAEQALLLAGPAGEYRVKCRLIKITAGEADVTELRETVTLTGGQPGPTPPGPVPPGPNPPGPAPDIDAALLAKFKTALAADVTAGATKARAADLATVYESGAVLLGLDDPAIAPRTVGDLYQKCAAASIAKEIPRRPYLEQTRLVVDAHVGQRDGATVLTPALKSEYQTKFRALAAALAEASK